jgi:hypothetical protein
MEYFQNNHSIRLIIEYIAHDVNFFAFCENLGVDADIVEVVQQADPIVRGYFIWTYLSLVVLSGSSVDPSVRIFDVQISWGNREIDSGTVVVTKESETSITVSGFVFTTLKIKNVRMAQAKSYLTNLLNLTN